MSTFPSAGLRTASSGAPGVCLPRPPAARVSGARTRTARVGGSRTHSTYWWLVHAHIHTHGTRRSALRSLVEGWRLNPEQGGPGQGSNSQTRGVSGGEGRAAAPPGGTLRRRPRRPRCSVQARRPGIPSPPARWGGGPGHHVPPTHGEVEGSQALPQGDRGSVASDPNPWDSKPHTCRSVVRAATPW